MRDRYYSDDICQIKRYKGRNKFEIFIHSKEFRALLEKKEMFVFREDLSERRKIEKKILSPSFAYAQYLQACYEYTWKHSQLEKGFDRIQQYLDYVVQDYVNSKKISEISEEEKYFVALEEAYRLIGRRIGSS